MPTRKPKNQETALSAAIQHTLTAKGCRVWRIQSGQLAVKYGDKTHFVHCAPKGAPDLLVIVPELRRSSGIAPARHIHLEVKTRTGAVSADQIKWQAWADANGVRSFVVRGIGEAVDAVFGSEVRSA